MVSTIIKLIFVPFTFEPVLYCCGFAFVGALFALISRFIHGNYQMGVF